MPYHLAQSIFNPALNARIGVTFTNTSAGKVQLLLQIVIDAAIGFGGLYFFFNLIRGGYEFISAGGDKDGVQSARKRIANSMIGMVVVLSVFVFLFVIETLFGISIRNFSIPNV